MKKFVYILLVSMLVLSGCSDNENTTDDAVNSGEKKLMGIVESVTNDSYSIKICGNSFWGNNRLCYVITDTESGDFVEGDNVTITYTGELEKSENPDSTDNSAYTTSIDNIVSIDKSDNDYVFNGNIKVASNFADENGEEYPADDSRSGCVYIITPDDGEAVYNFMVTSDDLSNEKFDYDEAVNVTYDPDTMKVTEVEPVYN